MIPEFWQIFKNAAEAVGTAAQTRYLGQKISVCSRCVVIESEAEAQEDQAIVTAEPYKLPSNLSRLEVATALVPHYTLNSNMARALQDNTNTQVLVLPDGIAHIVLGSTAAGSDKRTLASLAKLDSGFSPKAGRRWYVPNGINMCIPDADYTLCSMRQSPEMIVLLITSGTQSLYLPLLGQTKLEDIELETENETYRLSAWNIEERRYKKMVKKTISLADIVGARPGAPKQQDPAPEVQAAPEETQQEQPAATEATAEVESTTEVVEDAVVSDVEEVEDVAVGAVEETPEAQQATKPVKKTRTRKQVVPGLKMDWGNALRYLQQPVPDTMSVAESADELRIIRDIQIAAARRETNIALHVIARAEELEAAVAEFAAVREVLSKLKI